MTDNKTCDKCRNDIQNGSIACGQILKAVRNGIPYEERPQGEWIKKVDDVGFISHICSNCGSEIEVEDPCDDKFCYSCGAKMKGGADND